MQKSPSPKHISVRHVWQTLTTVWPQLISGLIFAWTLVLMMRSPSVTSLVLCVGAGLVFAFTVAYLYFIKRGSRNTLSLLTWIGGFAFAIFCAFAFPGFIALSVLFGFAAVCYGLGASGRLSMLIGTLVIWLALAFAVTNRELMAGRRTVVPNERSEEGPYSVPAPFPDPSSLRSFGMTL